MVETKTIKVVPSRCTIVTDPDTPVDLLEPITDTVTTVCTFAEDRELQGEHVTLYLFDDVSLLRRILEIKGDWNRWQTDDWGREPWPVVTFGTEAFLVASTDPNLEGADTFDHWTYILAKTATHGMFHRNGWEGQAPEWLNEGMADLITRLATAHANDAPYEHDVWRKADAEQAGPNLNQLEPGWGDAAGLEAAELLVAHTGIKAFAEFYSNLRGPNNWRQVFEDTFGLSVDQFYEQYEVHWNWGLPDLQIPLTDAEVKAWQAPMPPPSTQEQRQTLAEFYIATGGDNWTNNTDWLSDASLDDWHGIYTDQRGNVVELRLPNNNLTGNLPVSIADLPKLTQIYIPENKISGPIPAEIGQIASLETLDLWENQLTGSIPTELGNLKRLISLGLARNKLIGTIPPVIWELTELSILGLDGNNLTGVIPKEIGNLTALTWLDLGYNNLKGGIPTEIGNLVMLDHLGLGGNELTGDIPGVLGQLTALTFFDISGNELTGTIPTELGNLTNLDRVYVAGNSFEDCIPEPWRLVAGNDFNRLDILYCGANLSDPDDKAVLVKLYNATNGDEWHDNDNWLSDQPLAAWYGVDVDAEGKVTELDLWYNKLKGTLIPEIGQLDQLTSLTLDGNELSGTIPSELGSLNLLEGLSLSYNDLTGQIPVEIAELDKLWSLHLNDNELSGRIPAVIGNLSNLGYLDLSGNDLTGAMPPELASLTSLTDLYIASNKLTGEFPTWIGDLPELRTVSLSDNRLTGDISTISENLGHLTTFSIAGNNLTGCLPATLRDIEKTDFIFSRLNYCDGPQKQPPTTPTFIKWEVGDAVRTPEERAARLGVQWLFEYAESIEWPVVGDDITVYFMTLEPLVYASANEDGVIDEGEIESEREFISGIGGFAHDDANFNRATEVGDSISRSQLYGTASLLVHENLHTAFQFDLDGLYTSPSLARSHGGGAPAWYTEGMARYFDSLIPSFHSGETDFLCRGDCESTINGVPLEEIHLSSAEDSLDCAYTCGAFAIELLASMVGQRRIVDFYTMRRPGRTWQETFEDVFGISVPDFYALYDQHRDAGFPELNPPVAIPTTPDGETQTEQQPDNRDDRAALIAFYNSTRGNGWHDDTNWNSNQPMATWYGVSVDTTGRVQGLSLSENRLRGVIPLEVGNLTNLKWLYLNGNQIRSAIPNTITQLTNLEDLWLGENQLGGTIPEDIGNMTSLQYLALDYNNISGSLPASMMSMSNLRYLSLRNNDLSGAIPDNIGDMMSLEVLNLSRNRLTRYLPDSIGRLSNLRELRISSNRLSSTIPGALGNLTKLEHLDLSGNRLSGHLPRTLGNLINLKGLYLTGNRLSGTIPDEYSNMASLINFHFGDNQFIGQFPAWLTELEELSTLYLSGNPLTGCIPPALFDVGHHDLDNIPLPKCS